MADPALYHSPPAREVADALEARLRRRLTTLADSAVADLVADSVFYERKRLERDEAAPAYVEALESAAQALRSQSRQAMESAAYQMVRDYAEEIHNPFSVRTYRFATRLLPGTLTRLLSATKPRDLFTRDFDPASRMRLSGPIDRIRKLSETATLILAPTHVSNLDSPLIGYALYAAKLPPFAYGAGLNLFSNPAMGFFMHRLGAYTVDRRKKNRLYKDTLKDYSTEIIGRGHHSLFFPGGTRSRSGRLESNLKKGLLGTGLAAWQESLATGKPRDVYVVPCTLSMGLVLEAATLIADSLAEAGKQRYIISDDEFAQPRTIANFVRRVMRLDSAVHVVFGEPMDVMGNLVDETGQSLDPRGAVIDRRGYVCNSSGEVVADEQRDHLYTERVATRLCDAYARDFVAQSTHLVAWAAWEALRSVYPGFDTWRLVRLHPDQAVVERVAVAKRVEEALPRLHGHRSAMPATVPGILDEAVTRLASYHRRRALHPAGPTYRLTPELILYYRNRMVAWPGFR